MAQASKVIATAGVLTVGVETISAISERKLPTTRFLIGSGVAYLLLSALAEVEPEIAQAFAIAIATTVILTDEGSALKKVAAIGEKSEDRKRPTPRARTIPERTSPRVRARTPAVTPFPGIPTTGR